MTDERSIRHVQPLTRATTKGDRYVRPAAVEEEIAAVLDLPIDDAFNLAASGHLKRQTLVYLLRRFRPNRPSAAYNAMFLTFFAYLKRAGDRLMTSFPKHAHERAHEWVESKVLEWYDTDRMDTFETGAFSTTVERLYLSAMAYLGPRLTTELPREDMVSDESEGTGEDAADALFFTAGRQARPLAEVARDLESIRARLKHEQWLALFYVDGQGYTEMEAAGLMDCSDRKVRYLLSAARKIVRKMKG